MFARTVSRQQLLLRPAAGRPAALFSPLAAAAAAATPASAAFSTAAPASRWRSQRLQRLQRPRAPRAPPSFAAAGRRCLSDDTRAAIERAVASAPVVLFMKGTPEVPQCGFSRAAIQILGLQGVDPAKFAAFNVLEDAALRAGIKEFSDWPTIPQLYVDGEFVGGCDILVAMHQGGELAKLLEEKQVLVADGDKEAA